MQPTDPVLAGSVMETVEIVPRLGPMSVIVHFGSGVEVKCDSVR